MIRSLIVGGLFLGLMIVAWVLVEIHHKIAYERQKKDIRDRALEILRRKEAAKAELRKQKEDEAWGSYVLEKNQEMQDELGDDRQAG
jgi:hypothetical protein